MTDRTIDGLSGASQDSMRAELRMVETDRRLVDMILYAPGVFSLRALYGNGVHEVDPGSWIKK